MISNFHPEAYLISFEFFTSASLRVLESGQNGTLDVHRPRRFFVFGTDFADFAVVERETRHVFLQFLCPIAAEIGRRRASDLDLAELK